MNDCLDLLLRRRSVSAQALREPGPTPDELETLLTVAARVPDHGKLVPWRFIVIEHDGRHRIGEALARAFKADQPDASEDKVALERERLSRAPLVVAVVSRAKPHPKIPEWEQVLSAGAVCMNLVLGANAMGYGTSWVTGWYAFDRRILDVLGLGPNERIAGFIQIGRVVDPPAERPRPALSDIVTRF